MNRSDLPPTGHHICIEVKYEGWSWYCIGGVWYKENKFMNQLDQMHDEWVHVDVRAAYDRYLKDMSILADPKTKLIS